MVYSALVSSVRLSTDDDDQSIKRSTGSAAKLERGVNHDDDARTSGGRLQNLTYDHEVCVCLCAPSLMESDCCQSHVEHLPRLASRENATKLLPRHFLGVFGLSSSVLYVFLCNTLAVLLQA